MFQTLFIDIIIAQFLFFGTYLQYQNVRQIFIKILLLKMIEATDSLLFTLDIEALEAQLQRINDQMEMLAGAGKYILAETSKMNAQKLKKDIEAKRLEEASKRHLKEKKQIKKYLKDDLSVFNAEWGLKLKQHEQQATNMIAELKAKHKKEEAEQRIKLQAECFKGKQSSQLLNLRIIQLNLAKQLNFVEAQLVQKQVRQLQKKEQEGWEKAKQEKIEKEIELLKTKQLVELRALNKKVASTKWELEIERTKAEAKLVLKHSVVVKQLNSQNKKQSLALKGEFKSKCSVVSPGRSILSPSKSFLSPSKSRILSCTSQTKFLPEMTR